jgi:nucleoside-diphosphate-sugar epimerase
MVNVAIAGGTGGVGKTIVEILTGNTNHQAFILSRKVRFPPSLLLKTTTLTLSQTCKDIETDTPCIEVDYTSIPSLQAILEQHRIETVICTFGITSASLGISQLNLIKAAELSKETKRFIPSSFAIPYPRSAIDILPPLEHYFDAITVLRTSGLIWAEVHNGIFLDYFGMPKVKTHLSPNVIAIDLAHNMAAIPGDGNIPVTFTYTFDLARFLVAALDLETWPETMKVVGDTVTWNEFVKLAEEAKGAKFAVSYDSIVMLKRFEITELPGHQALYRRYSKRGLQWFLSIFELWTTDGTSEVTREGSLNEVFPEIMTMTVRGILEMY